MPTLYALPKRAPWRINELGEEEIIKRYDEIVSVVVDLADELDTDTISSIAWEDSGVTRSGVSNTTTTVTFLAAGTGYSVLTATTAAGAKIQKKLWFREPTGSGSESDYDR